MPISRIHLIILFAVTVLMSLALGYLARPMRCREKTSQEFIQCNEDCYVRYCKKCDEQVCE